MAVVGNQVQLFSERTTPSFPSSRTVVSLAQSTFHFHLVSYNRLDSLNYRCKFLAFRQTSRRVGSFKLKPRSRHTRPVVARTPPLNFCHNQPRIVVHASPKHDERCDRAPFFMGRKGAWAHRDSHELITATSEARKHSRCNVAVLLQTRGAQVASSFTWRGRDWAW